MNKYIIRITPNIGIHENDTMTVMLHLPYRCCGTCECERQRQTKFCRMEEKQKDHSHQEVRKTRDDPINTKFTQAHGVCS